MKRLITSIIILVTPLFVFSQNLESIRNKKFFEFCNYIKNIDSLNIDNQIITNKYVDIGYITPDNNIERLNFRLAWLRKFVIGLQVQLQNQDLNQLKVVPITKFKNSNLDLVEGLKRFDDNVYGVYKFDKPNQLLFCLYYEPDAEKVASWVLINQGGYYYFFKLNLIGNYK